MKRFCINSECS